MANDYGSTTVVTALPHFGAPLHQRLIAATLYGKTSSAVAVVTMLVLAIVEWSRIFAGHAPRLNVYLTVVSIAVLLGAGRLLRAFLDARSER